MHRRLSFALSSLLTILTASCHPSLPNNPPDTNFISNIQLGDALVYEIAQRPDVGLTWIGASPGESGGGSWDHSRHRKTLFMEGHLSSEDRIESLMNYLAQEIDNQLQKSDVEGAYMGETIQKEHGTYSFRREYSKITDELRTKGFIDVLVTARSKDHKGELASLVVLISEGTIRK